MSIEYLPSLEYGGGQQVGQPSGSRGQTPGVKGLFAGGNELVSQHSLLSSLPNLPGYRYQPSKSTQANPGAKKSAFTFVRGEIFLKDDNLPPTSGSIEHGSVASIGAASSAQSKRAKSRGGGNENVNVTLTFQAYFEELAEKGDGHELRVRRCNIYYFLENGTMAIVEKPQLNSGIPQGTLVRRGIVHKPDGEAYGPEDLKLGEEIVVYGRRFKLVDCDAATRKYMRRNFNNAEPSTAVTYPVDDYEEFRKTIQKDTSGGAAWGQFNIKKNDGTRYQQAKMGCNPDANKGKEGFIRYGDKTLQFLCVWDNTHAMYGDRVQFSVVYHLCDDTFEIYSLPGANGNKESFSRLLKRAKLPKHFGGLRGLQEPQPDESTFYHWTDIFIGIEIDVYSRLLRVIDADSSTRGFYSAHGCDLEPAEEQPAPKVIMHEREIPPPTAFGSEEDSMRSCVGSLMPGPPPAKKYGENRQVCFFASLLSGGLDDVDRRFVITYYVSDSTLKVQEPPIRNSGFTGGVFLSRRAVKTPSGEPMLYSDLYVGCKLQVLKHRFLLLDSNDSTLRWMEDKKLPRADVYAVLAKIRPYLYDDALSGQLSRMFQSRESGAPEESGRITRDALRDVFSQYGLMGDDEASVSEHELITIQRGAGNKLATFEYSMLVSEILQPTDHYK